MDIEELQPYFEQEHLKLEKCLFNKHSTIYFNDVTVQRVIKFFNDYVDVVLENIKKDHNKTIDKNKLGISELVRSIIVLQVSENELCLDIKINYLKDRLDSLIYSQLFIQHLCS